jgi:hypothetical protein
MKVHSFALLAYILIFLPDTCWGNKVSRQLTSKKGKKERKEGKLLF